MSKALREILLILYELKGCGCEVLDGVAVMEFEITDVVSAPGELEPTSPQAAFKGVIAGSSVKSVVTSAGGL